MGKVTVLTANDIYRDGRGVAKLNGKICFVQNLLIGERAECEIVNEEKNYIEARAVKLIDISPCRIAPDCPVYERCGGCDYRHTTYENELNMKLIALRGAYRRYGVTLPDDIRILASESERRNKATFHVNRSGAVELGFYDKGSHDFVNAENCRIVSDNMKGIASRLCEWLKNNKCVADISLRETSDGKEASLLLEAKSFDFDVSSLKAALEGSTVCSVGVRVGRRYRHLFGSEYITDTLCGNRLMISPGAFYQINPAQAGRAYMTALDFADAKDSDILLDVYCGIGSIGLAAAKRVKEVYGIEIVKEAVDNANNNAALNGIQNARFFCADAAAGLKALADKGITPDIAVVDPPRAGLDGACIGVLTDFGLKRIAYISCEPSTQARDVKAFLDNGYTLERICAVDFFKRTRHIESVVLLNKD